MYPDEGLKNALNKMREMSVQNGSIYHQYVDVVTEKLAYINKRTGVIKFTEFTTGS